MIASRNALIIALALAVAITALFLPVKDHGFVKYDDGLYVFNNSHVMNGISRENISWAFTTTHASNWHPLTWLSHMADVELFGLNPGAHHLVNVAFHALNSLLLFLVLRGMTGALWRSALAAALFAVHPLHVESVAWIAERKDVLSAFFWIATMAAYLWYARKPGGRRYLVVLSAYSLGLLAKPMLVTLPFVLLLLDYWPLGRVTAPPPAPGASKGRRNLSPSSRLFLEKVPLLALAGAASVVTYRIQKITGAVNLEESRYVTDRVFNALVSYVRYLSKTVWPGGLSVFYPYSLSPPDLWKVSAALALLLAVSLLAAVWMRRYGFVAVGWFWYLGTLVPVIGLVKVGAHSMSDRYTYIPLIGIFIALSWGLALLAGKSPHLKRAAVAASSAVLVLLAIRTHFQVRYWESSLTLFGRALEVTSGNWLAHTKVGNELFFEGRSEEALRHYREALKIDPFYVEANNNIGLILARKGDPEGAARHFTTAMQSRPDDAVIRYNLANALYDQGEVRGAIRQYREVLRLAPQFMDARQRLREASRLQEAPSGREGGAADR